MICERGGGRGVPRRRRGGEIPLFLVVISVALAGVSVTEGWLAGTGVRFPRANSASSRLNPNCRVHVVPGKEEAPINPYNTTTGVSPLSFGVDELATVLGGKGRALAVWDFYRNGIDPLDGDHERRFESADSSVLASTNPKSIMGSKTRKILKGRFGGPIRDTVAQVAGRSVAKDGTTKLLLQLHRDNLLVEMVIIPWEKRRRSTLCVSSQVGCRQACTFCQTGRMGKFRSLSSEEMLAQVFFAVNVCLDEGLYRIDNVVFMGMGEPADNAEEVVKVTKILADDRCFQLAPRRVTVSTVAPSPDAFNELGRAPAVLAWSVHSSRDVVRRQLVPTTRYPMTELREGLILALLQRSRRQRAIMLEITLLDQVNDSTDDAEHLGKFCEPLFLRVTGVKVIVNLIPWNDISASVGAATRYKRPSRERVKAFQDVLTKKYGISCYIRITRGDDENAACGQLATTGKRIAQSSVLSLQP